MKNLKSQRSFIVLIFLFGIGIGLLIAIYIFAVDVDILAIPYLNRGVILKENLEVKQNSISLNIPTGTELKLVRQMPGAREYTITVIIPWDDGRKTKALSSKPKPFEFEGKNSSQEK